MNKPVELWNLLLLIDREGCVANDWMQFVTKYCGGYKGKFGWVTDGATNTFQLNQLLRDNCYIRREKRDVLKELPATTKQILNCNITNKKKYQRAVDDFIEFIRQEQGEEKAEKAQEAEHLVAIGQMRKLTIEGKLKAVEQYLKDWKEADNGKLVIFGLHREQLDYLSNKFNSKLIAGGVSSKMKSELIEDFQKNDDIFIFGNMESMGTGVDGLQYVCSNMLITELPWRPSDLDQAIGRLDRSGQEVPVTITFMLAEGTIDTDMWDMLAEKELVTEAVNKGIDVKRNKSGMKNVMKRIINKNGKTNISKSN
jgi:SWI/SNF-related matrix-associated actin-dependent regulator 1 of chromatin subfamily A